MDKKFIILLIVLLCMSSCKKNENSEAQKENGLNIKSYVTTPAGEVLRSSPDIHSQGLATVPYKEELIIVKYSDSNFTMNKINAPWAFIKFKNLQGWVFSGSLMREVKTGNYKNHDLEQLKNEVSKAYKTDFKSFKSDNEKIYNTPGDIKIKEINGDYCIIEYTTPGCLEWNPDTGQALWYYKDNKWNDFGVVDKLQMEGCASGVSIKLVDINNDGFIDIIIEGGVSDSSTALVYLNDGNNLNIVDIPKDGEESSVEFKGSCGETVLNLYKFTDQGEKRRSLKFDCSTNKFK